MSITLLETTPKQNRHYFIALVIGVITGIISAFVKSGTEDILPPRTPDRIAPPVQMLTDMGIDWHSLVYSYSDQLVYWGGNFVHIVFSIAATVFYCVVAEIFPRITMLQGIVFGILFSVICHGIMLPILGLSPAIIHLPADEIISEILGTCLWIWSVELLRIALREKMTKI
ncbi:MAG: YagU family protein [Hafnia alvei]|uniref:YagU family protein n=1 Tax=Hafnia alvei TaxID=569 RepID=UPI003F9067D5